MKRLLSLLLLLAALVLQGRAADYTFLGGTTLATGIHPTTNYVLMVFGSSTGAVYRLVNISNIWKEAATDLPLWSISQIGDGDGLGTTTVSNVMQMRGQVNFLTTVGLSGIDGVLNRVVTRTPGNLMASHDTVTPAMLDPLANTWLTSLIHIQPTASPPGSGGLVQIGATNYNYISASSNVLINFTNMTQDVTYCLTISNGANVSVIVSNSAAFKVPSMPAGQFPTINSNGLTTLVVRYDAKSGSTNLLFYHSKEFAQSYPHSLLTTNTTTDTVTQWPNYFTNSLPAGVGGANTNFTLVLPYDLEATINGFTNVSIRAVMGYDATKTIYASVVITNLSGSNRTLEFSAVTNRWNFSGVYGTAAPSVLTNGTKLRLAMAITGTNVDVGYASFLTP